MTEHPRRVHLQVGLLTFTSRCVDVVTQNRGRGISPRISERYGARR